MDKFDAMALMVPDLNPRLREQFAGILRQVAHDEREACADALGQLVQLIDAAGLDNLTNGVQLRPTNWFVKMSDAMAAAKELLPPDPNHN